mgnify:CR=1 FL=1
MYNHIGKQPGRDMKGRIFLDNNATTPLDPRVLEKMLIDLSGGPYNPSSLHFFGQEGKKLLSRARAEVAQFIGVKPNEIIFTSGGTESMNFLIKGIAEKNNPIHIITSSIEHASVYYSMQHLEKKGASVTFLSPGLWGAPKPTEVLAAITPQTGLIVLSAANSETGVLLDLDAIAQIAFEAKIPFIVDGVALLGKKRFTVPKGVTGMGFSSHKIHGPKGVGFVYLQSNCKIEPQFFGGGQESSLRGGTENLSGILGLSSAIEILQEEIDQHSTHMKYLQNLLENGLKSLSGISINGQGPRLPNTSNITFDGVDGEDLFIALDMEKIAVSQGSACASGAREPSRVLLHMGMPKKEALSSLRFSLSRMNTEEEILHTIRVVKTLTTKLRICP